ncbi:MAG TPA: LytTR family transcriptional regulator DNA-binding domain-containing protein [Flavobacteriales bacterium]|nr:LytTR family transcriptional regulator DNA-binding domain-containing protein [Flavobacteriales bacterium]
MDYTLLIVEDEFSIAMDMQMRLEEMGYEVIGISISYEEALLKIAEEKPEIVLMDINLNKEKTGIDVAAKVYANFHIPVVFVTAFSDKTTFEKAMETMPLGYVLKPFKDVDLSNAIELAMRQHNAIMAKQRQIDYLSEIVKQNEAVAVADGPAYIFIKNKGQLEKVFVEEFIFLEALDNYTTIYTINKKYTINAFLKDLHSQLPENKFLRIHRSYVVNTDAIKSIDDNLIYLKNNTSIPVSKSYRTDFFNRIKILS